MVHDEDDWPSESSESSEDSEDDDTDIEYAS